ncbi:PP2C family protein-serine/threonine phosphatase [Streptosporangium sp. NPDC001559]|uniref:PP2C family protein-serine/threonine phosphatase n=1 Tax=Streptosporangium sp. NPDC001559 TaxID=3366187 RepID=UPI0036E69B25
MEAVVTVNVIRFKGPDDLPPRVFDPVRLAAVRATGLLDTGPETVFDDLAHLAASATGAPMAFITVVDERRSFWKSVIGLGGLGLDERQNAVEASLCHLVVAADEPLIVTDAAADPRVNDISSITRMGIGAWAGYPIHAPDGQVLGTVCAVDTVPRAWNEQEIRTLATLARAVTGEIALREAVRRMSVQMADLRTTFRESQALARSLQDSLLPPVLAAPPGLDTAAAYLPAGHGALVLGDFYDLFAVGPSSWCAILGDVAGHGVQAAKVTALARYTVRADAPRHFSPAQVLAQLNSALIAQQIIDQQFLTVVCAIFRDQKNAEGIGVTGVLSTAGHPSALLRRADGQVEEVRSNGAILGVFPDAGLGSARFTLHPGDALLLYTDGVTEAHPPRDAATMFGEERLTGLLADCHGLEAAQIVERISHTVLDFCHHDSADDIALLVLRVPPAPRN